MGDEAGKDATAVEARPQAVAQTPPVRRGQKPGPKPKPPKGRRPRTRPVPPRGKAPSRRKSKAVAQTDGDRPGTTKSRRAASARPLLPTQHGPLSPSPIRALPAPPADATIDEDQVTWVSCLLPSEHQTRRNAVRLAHHLTLLPQASYDPDLSIPLAFVSCHMSPERLVGTRLAARLGWTRADRPHLMDQVRRHIADVCEARTGMDDSPTHATSLGHSLVSAMLAPRGRGRAVPPPGVGAGDAAPTRSSDQKAQAHRGRANRRQDLLVAIVDQACGVLGPAAPMVSDRVLERYVARVRAFRSNAGDRSIIAVEAEHADADGWNEHPVPRVHPGNVLQAVRLLGADGARRRTTTPARAAAEAELALFERRQRLVGDLRRKASGDGSPYVPLLMRLSLRGAYYDTCRALPFTVADGAALLRRVVDRVVTGWDAVSVVDATSQGHPHVHLVVLVPSAQRRLLHARVVDAYAHVGIDARGSVRLDVGAAPRRRAWLATARRLSVDGADHGWTYALDKVAPVTTSIGRHADRARVEPRVRLAAWRTAHGVRPAWRAHHADAASAAGPPQGATRAGRRTLPMAGPGAATLLDEAIERASEAERARLGDQADPDDKSTT